jgi:hypothetical protein
MIDSLITALYSIFFGESEERPHTAPLGVIVLSVIQRLFQPSAGAGTYNKCLQRLQRNMCSSSSSSSSVRSQVTPGDPTGFA